MFVSIGAMTNFTMSLALCWRGNNPAKGIYFRCFWLCMCPEYHVLEWKSNADGAGICRITLRALEIWNMEQMVFS